MESRRSAILLPALVVAILVGAEGNNSLQELGRETGAGPDDARDREAVLAFNTASHLYRQKNWREAAAQFESYLKRFPQHRDVAEARFARGYCLNRLGRHTEAVRELRLAARHEKASWTGDALFYLGRSLEALAAGASTSSEDRRTYLLDAAKNFGRAAAQYRGAGAGGKATSQEKSASRDLELLASTSQAEALHRAGRFRESAQALGPLESRGATFQGSPHYSRALYILAMARYSEAERQGRPGKADFTSTVEALSKLAAPAFEKDPLWEEATFFLARLLERQGRYGEARSYFQRLVARGNERAAEAAYYGALSLYENHAEGDLRKTAEEFARFRKLHPRHALAAQAAYYEALSLFDLKRYAEAAAKFGEIGRTGRGYAGRAWLHAGQALLLGKPQDAVKATQALREAVELLGAGARPEQARLAEATYWLGEAQLARGGPAITEAAATFGEVATRFSQVTPELAEKALYQQGRALFLAGDRRACARAARRYREAYPQGRGRFFAESLELSAENALQADPGEIDDQERRAAPAYYAEAAVLRKADVPEARRLRYLSGVALYYCGDYPGASSVLTAVYEEDRRQPHRGFSEPDLKFFLGDSLLQTSRSEDPRAEDLQRWRRAAALFGEYVVGPRPTHRPRALLSLGLCQKWLGEYSRAKETFAAFLGAHSDHPLAAQVRFELANVHLTLEERKSARREYGRVAADAESPLLAARALLQVASIERSSKNPREAITVLDSLSRRHGAALAVSAEGQSLLLAVDLERGKALAEAGEREKAREALEKHIENNPESPHVRKARIELGYLFLEADQPDEALKALEPLTRRGTALPEQDQALYVRARSFLRLAERSSESSPERARCAEEAEKSYQRLIAEHPKSDLALDARVELGQQFFNRSAYAEAKKWFLAAEALLRKRKEEGRMRDLLEHSLFGLGFVAFEEKEYSRAAELFDRVAARSASRLSPRALFQSARALMFSHREKEAAGRLEQLVGEPSRAGNHLEESLLRLGECYHRLRRYPDSVKTLERMLKEFPEGTLHHEGRFALGYACQFSDDFEAAVKHFRKVAAGTRQVVAARAQYHVGECFMDQGKHREAARAFLTVVANFDLEGPYQDWVRRALLGAGLAYEAAGDRAAAAQQLGDLVKRFPDSEEAAAAAKHLEEVKQ